MTTPVEADRRGVLGPDASRQHYSLDRFAAPPDLAHLVAHLWVVEWDLAVPFTAQVLPHPNVNLCVMAGASRISGTGRSVFSQHLEGSGRVVGVTYRPGAFRTLHGESAHTLTDATIPVTDVYATDVAALEQATLDVPVPQAVAVVESLLRSRTVALSPAAELAGRIVETVVADRSLGRVDELAARFSMPVWKLQRLLAEHVGLTPKWLLVRARLHDATDALADDPSPDWARLAADLGYCDQSHFIRAFKAAVGVTPTEYTARGVDGS